MWDEEKFFKDFVRESENIKPDAQFVNELKQLAADDGDKAVRLQRNKKIRTARQVMVFAVLMIVCIAGLGMYLKSDKKTDKSDAENESIYQTGKTDVYAGSDETSIYIGTIGGKSELEKAIDFLEDGKVSVTDAAGKNISTKERKNILQKLNNVKHIVERNILEELKDDTEYEVYQVEEEEMIIKIYDSGYVVINGTALYRIEE